MFFKKYIKGETKIIQNLKNTIYILLTVFFFACNDNSINSKTSDITIQLPFESSNYDDFSCFVLYDSSGKKCIAQLDTITKGGGTIEYENLPNGMYRYSIIDVFNDTITKKIKIDSSKFISFYNECFDVKNVIENDSLRSAKKIKLIIEQFDKSKKSDTSDSDEINIEKQGNKYLVTHNFRNNNGWSYPMLLDSSKMMNALSEFETRIIGLREMGIKENNYSYPPINSVYLKCDNQYLAVYDTKNIELNIALQKLKQAILQ
jgi:hypothetical protein